jgi:DNA-binding MarR family transcriptional regulator
MKRKMNIHEILTRYWPRTPRAEVDAACERVWKRIETELDKRDTSLRSLYGDGWSVGAVNQSELQVLTAASMMDGQADIHSITDVVQTWTGGTMIGKVYATLNRLEKRGFIAVHRSAPAVKDGEPVIHFEVTEEGGRALRRAKAEGKHAANVLQDEAGEAKGRVY